MSRRTFNFAFLLAFFVLFFTSDLKAGEDRYVSSASNAGPGSLRQAILDSQPGTIITFDATLFNPSNQTMIGLSTAPDNITHDLTIDASSAGVTLDAGFAFNTIFNITGGTVAIKGLRIQNTNSHCIDAGSGGVVTVDGCVIMACSDGIRVTGNLGTSIIKNCHIGTNQSWEDRGGGGDGFFVTAAADCQIGTPGEPNYICFWDGSNKAGIRHGAGTLKVIGNYIGTNPAGANLGNFRGIDQQAGAGPLTLGGTAAGSGNVIGFSANFQVNLQSNSGSHFISGNYIGTSFDGSWLDLGPADCGIRVQDTSASAAFVIGHADAPNHIGFHDTPGKAGIRVDNGNVTIEGNYIGTNKSGDDLGNHYGIDLPVTTAGNVTVGGTGQNEANVIGHSNGEQLRIGATAGTFLVKGNWIGVTRDGATLLDTGGMANGISVTSASGSPTITIGGSSGSERNWIGNHTQASVGGIKLTGSATVQIRANHVGRGNKGGNFKNTIGVYLDAGFTGTAQVGDATKRLRLNSLNEDFKIVAGTAIWNGKISCFGDINIPGAGGVLNLGTSKLFVSGDFTNSGTVNANSSHVTFDGFSHTISGVITFDSLYYRGGGVFQPPQLAANELVVVQKGALKILNKKLVLGNNAKVLVGESLISKGILTLDNAVVQSNNPGTDRFALEIRKFGDIHAKKTVINSLRTSGMSFASGSRIGTNTQGRNGFKNFKNVTFDNIPDLGTGMNFSALTPLDGPRFPTHLRGIRFNKAVGATTAKNVQANATSPSIFFQLHPDEDFGTVATDGESGDTDPLNRIGFGPDLRIVSLEFHDLSADGNTDQVVVSFDAPVKDLSVSVDSSTTPPRVSGFYVQQPAGGGTVRPNQWHSHGPINDTRLALILSNPQSSGTATKDLIYYSDMAKIAGVTSGLLLDFVTADNAGVNRTNLQGSVVTSDTPQYADNGSSLTSVTLDFSGIVPADLRDPNRWLVISKNGVQLTIQGVSVDDSNNSLHITLDGTLGNVGTPKVGWIDFNPAAKMTGLSALPGTTGGSPSIQLNWNTINHPALTGYVLFRKTNLANPWVALTETTNTVTLDQTVATSTQYYYIGRALYANGSISLPTVIVPAMVNGSPPTVTTSVSPSSGTAPLQVTFTGSATDSDGTIVLYEWDFNTADSNPVNYTSPNSPNTTFTYFEPGSYTARLRAHDNSGNFGVSTVQITVSAPANAPTAGATLSVSGGPPPLTVTFSDTSTAGANPIALWEWDFEGDGNIDFSSTVTGNTVHVYRLPNQTYSSVKLRVTDTDGKSDTETFTVTVNAGTNAPLVTLDAAQATGPDGTPVSPSGSLPYCVTFDATTYDAAGGTIVRWEYDFNGDGVPDRLVTADTGVVTHCYVLPGIYTPTVTVRDDSGIEAIAGTTVTVTPPTNVNVMLVEPVTGDKVAGNFLMLRARTIPAPITSTVLFERSTNGTTWTQVGSTKTGAKFHYLQGFDLSGFADGTAIYLRARATDVNSNTDTSPVVKVFKVSLAQAEVYEQLTNGKLTKEASFDGTSETDFTTSTGAGFKIPLDAISQDAINTGGLRAKIIERGNAGPRFAITTGLPTSGGSPTVSNIGATYSFDIFLGNGGEVEVPQKPLTLTIPYPDENDDGIIDGTSQNESTIKVYWYDEVTDKWKATQETSVDTENNLVTVTTAHLTDFGMFATVVSSALGGGAGVPGGATAGAGLCLVGDGGATWLFVSGLLIILGTVVLIRRRRA